MPNRVFNIISSFSKLVKFGRLHGVIQSNIGCDAHWERILCQDAHHAKPLFDVLEYKEALRWTLSVRSIDVRGWELHLRDPRSKATQYSYLSHNHSLIQVCVDGDLLIVKAMVERTQVDLESRAGDGRTALHEAAVHGHLPVVQYLCEQRADKEARDVNGGTPLRWAAGNGHRPVEE